MRILASILILIFVRFASAAVVQTLDGRSLTGDVRISSGDQITLTPSGGPAIKIPLSEILTLQFKDSAAPAGAANARWIGHDIGSPPVQGSARFIGGNVIVKASGAEIGMDRDQGYFVYQMLAGDGQITARVASIGHTNALAKAGVMIRGGLDKGAASASVLFTASERMMFRYRSRPMGVSTTLGERDGELPAWVRLVRRGDKITGFVSDDGNDWDEMGSMKLALPGPAMIGVAVTSHNVNAVCTASFEKVAIGGMDAINAGAPSTPSRGIVLRDGSILSGEIRSATDSAIRVRRGDQELSIPPTDVSRIILLPLSSQLMTRMTNPRVGVILASGDVVEGEFQGITDGRVVVSSVLFGLKKFNLNEVAAVILNDTPAAPPARNFEIVTSDGSSILVDKLSSESQNLIAETSFAGKLKLTQDELSEIRAGRSRFKALTDLKPTIAGPPEAVSLITSAASSKLTIRGQTPSRAIRLSTSSAINYKLDGGYRMLALRFAVPDGILPLSPVRLVVLVDGKEIHRTPPITSLDDPAPVSIKLAGAQSFTLRLESDGPGQLGGSAVLIDPSLIQ